MTSGLLPLKGDGRRVRAYPGLETVLAATVGTSVSGIWDRVFHFASNCPTIRRR